MTTFSWLPDAAWRGALLLAMAFVIARVLKSQPAATRHVLWATALAGVMAMPMLPTVASLPIPVTVRDLVRMTGERGMAHEDVAAPEPSGVGDGALETTRSAVGAATDVALVTASGGTLTSEAPAATPVGAAVASWRSRLTLWNVVTGLWLAGVAILTLRLAAGFLVLRRLRRRAEPVEDPALLELVATCATRMGTHAAPALLASPAAAMPCTAGWVNPVILLPDEYEEWPTDRLEVVLMHELGHIRRLDIVPHLLAEVARVVYWFNPLVWLAAARLRAEAESATDARVVHAGARASDYAAHLLDIVREARPTWNPAPIIPLARRTEFEGRILSILEGDARVRPSVRHVAAVVTLVCGLTLGVASMSSATAVTVGDVTHDPSASTGSELMIEPDGARSHDEPSGSETHAVVSAQSPAARADRERTAGALAEALRDPVPAVREAAAQALGGVRDSVAVRALIEVLRTDESATVRRSAAWSLGELADAAAIPALSEALARDRDVEVRKNAAAALGHIEHARATPALVQALERDTEPAVRTRAAESLASIEDPASIDALIRALDRDADPDVRLAVIEAIGHLDDARALPAVSRALRDANAEVRRAAAEALGGFDDREAVPSLMAVVRDGNAEVRRAVMQSLANLGDRRALSVFVAGLSDADVEIRRAAAAAFDDIENLRTTPPELIRAMDDTDAEVRHSVAHALGHIGDPEAMRALIAHVGDANVEVRRAVVDALDGFDDPAVASALRAALRDTDPEVRESAARALGNRSRK